MENIKKIYENLTNVDIDLQRLLWDERGKGYYGEFLVFCELYPLLPGNCKILMNVNIPSSYGKTTEIDLLLIHETGLYVFEMKHYKGTIYGKANESRWTQYFRTAPNQHFRNPVAQNQYHIDALKKIVPEMPIHSYIVFTSNECDLRVECNQPGITACKLISLRHHMQNITSRPSVLNMEQINHLFCSLLPYSPVSQQPVNVQGREIPFCEYMSSICANYAEQEKQLKDHWEVQSKQSRLVTKSAIGVAALIVLTSIVINLLTCVQYKKRSDKEVIAAQQELATFAQKFEQVSDFNNGDLVVSKNLITPANVVLGTVPDLENAVSFSCTLIWNGTDYGISIGENAVLIAMLNDGSIKECPIYNSIYPYTSDYRIGKSNNAWYFSHAEADIPRHDFYDISVSDIAYIKLANIDIWTNVKNQPKIVASGYEIELYRAE